MSECHHPLSIGEIVYWDGGTWCQYARADRLDYAVGRIGCLSSKCCRHQQRSVLVLGLGTRLWMSWLDGGVCDILAVADQARSKNMVQVKAIRRQPTPRSGSSAAQCS